MSDILQAARSYYGLADTDVRKTDIYTNEAGQPMLVFELALSAEDFIAIGARMQKMQQPDTQPDTATIEGPTMEEMRKQYDALGKAGKGKYGSFGSYMAVISSGIVSDAIAGHMDSVTQTISNAKEGRQVVHVDAPEEPEPVSMDAVWLLGSEIPPGMQFESSDQRINVEKGDFEYLIQWAMLTDEQKQKAKEGNEPIISRSEFNERWAKEAKL